MTRSPQPLHRILAADPRLAAWDARRRRELAVFAIVRRQLPRTLAEHIRVTDARGPELELATDAGAIAAVVRQRGPALVAELRREGLEFTGLRVRAQPRSQPAPPRKVLSNPVDRAALRPLLRLARELPASPLKDALTRFLRRVG